MYIFRNYFLKRYILKFWPDTNSGLPLTTRSNSPPEQAVFSVLEWRPSAITVRIQSPAAPYPPPVGVVSQFRLRDRATLAVVDTSRTAAIRLESGTTQRFSGLALFFDWHVCIFLYQLYFEGLSVLEGKKARLRNAWSREYPPEWNSVGITRLAIVGWLGQLRLSRLKPKNASRWTL
jgi:hypothetical protein